MKDSGAFAQSSIHGKKIAKVRNAVVRIVTISREKKRAGRLRTSEVLQKRHTVPWRFRGRRPRSGRRRKCGVAGWPGKADLENRPRGRGTGAADGNIRHGKKFSALAYLRCLRHRKSEFFIHQPDSLTTMRGKGGRCFLSGCEDGWDAAIGRSSRLPLPADSRLKKAKEAAEVIPRLVRRTDLSGCFLRGLPRAPLYSVADLLVQVSHLLVKEATIYTAYNRLRLRLRRTRARGYSLLPLSWCNNARNS